MEVLNMSSIIRGFQAFTGKRPPQAPQQQKQQPQQDGGGDYFQKFQDGVKEMMNMAQPQGGGESEEAKRARGMMSSPMIMDGFGGGMMAPTYLGPKGRRTYQQ
jgi:hypothetical protein